MDIREKEWDGMDWIGLIWLWRALVNTVMNVQVV
jgi:hypothetical protein